MRYRVAKDAEPQFTLLLIATILSILLWVISGYLPLLGYVVYPLQLFATFVHEGGHALAAILTGNSVQSLTVASDGSGEVYSLGNGFFSGLLISSAGYLGTTAFGAGLLAWMRAGYSSRIALFASAGFVAVMTLLFGFLAPIFNFFSTATAGSVIFTVFAGVVLTAGLAAVGYFAKPKWSNFALAFLAVQCLLNAIFSLIDLFFITAMTNTQTDALNMANATGIPSLVWVAIWFGVSVLMISLGLRFYAMSRRPKATDSVFED